MRSFGDFSPDCGYTFRESALALDHDCVDAFASCGGGEGIPLRKIAEVIGQNLDAPAVRNPSKYAAKLFNWLTPFIEADDPVSSQYHGVEIRKVLANLDIPILHLSSRHIERIAILRLRRIARQSNLRLGTYLAAIRQILTVSAACNAGDRNSTSPIIDC